LTYRIWSNTTEGRGNFSVEKNLPLLWDCSWNYTTDVLRAIGGWNEVKQLGNLTIFNTGDSEYLGGCVLNFDLSYSTNVFTSTGINDLRYNSSIWPTVNNVIPETNFGFIINATYLDIQNPTSDEVEFIIKESTLKTNTSQSSFNSTLVNSQSGPYLYQSITETPSNVLYLTNDPIENQNPINLGAYLRNIMGDGTENRTAYNVTFAWILPAEFSVSNVLLRC
jgi:hypothetical protein